MSPLVEVSPSESSSLAAFIENNSAETNPMPRPDWYPKRMYSFWINAGRVIHQPPTVTLDRPPTYITHSWNDPYGFFSADFSLSHGSTGVSRPHDSTVYSGTIPYSSQTLVSLASGAYTDVMLSIGQLGIVPFTSRWYYLVSQRLTDLWQRYPIVVDAASIVAMEIFANDTIAPSVLPGEDGQIEFLWHRKQWDVIITVGSVRAEMWANERSTDREILVEWMLGEPIGGDSPAVQQVREVLEIVSG